MRSMNPRGRPKADRPTGKTAKVVEMFRRSPRQPSEIAAQLGTHRSQVYGALNRWLPGWRALLAEAKRERARKILGT